jgi:hypothetical protein
LITLLRLGVICVAFTVVAAAQMTYDQCHEICRASAESLKKSCLAGNCKTEAAVAGAAASLAAGVACGLGTKSPTLVRACDKAAGVAAALAVYSHCQTTCSVEGAAQYGACMQGCMPTPGSIKRQQP